MKIDQYHSHNRSDSQRSYSRSRSRKKDNKKHHKNRKDKHSHHYKQQQSRKHRKHYKQDRQRSYSRQHKRDKYQDKDKIKVKRQYGVKRQQQVKVKFQAMRDEQIQHQSNISEKQPEIQKPSFQPSGILLQYYNAREGVSLKFNQPPEARQPKPNQWRIYPFKEHQPQNPILLVQSCYLIGKDDRICDILCENPSISRQHAVIQFRAINKVLIDGNYEEQVKAYIIDLQSTNGTFLNGQKIEPSRYYQLLNKDSVKFGFSTRQYVFFRTLNSQEDQQN